MAQDTMQVAVHVDDGTRVRWEVIFVAKMTNPEKISDVIDGIYGFGDWDIAMALFPDGEVLEVEGCLI